MVPLADPELLDSREIVESLDPQAPWEWLVPLVPVALLVLWADLETVARLDPVVLRDLPVLLELKAPLALLDPVVRRVWLERGETKA